MTQPHIRFIVFEGLDGAGTTTQAGLLHTSLTLSGTNSFKTFEPTDEPTGRFIRAILGGEAQTATGQPFRPSERAMALLFAADRLAHSVQLNEKIAGGATVVCDRYILSSLAYQTLDRSIDPAWVIAINSGCTIPDVTFFLRVPVDVCLQRISARSEAPSVYEKRSFLDTIAANYERLENLYQTNYGRMITLDGTLPAKDVHAAVVDALANL